MSTESKEHLSQLMDGELGGEPARFLLRRLEASSELRGSWVRYHVIRDCVRYQDRGFADNSLGERVRNAIDAFEANGPQGRIAAIAARRWLRPLTGLAVAAGVAMMAVVAVAPNLPTGGGVDARQVSGTPNESFTSPNILTRGPVSRQVNLSGGDEPAARRMNSYLLRHYQVAGSSGGNGFVSFVPIVVSKSATQPPLENEALSSEDQEAETDSQ